MNPDRGTDMEERLKRCVDEVIRACGALTKRIESFQNRYDVGRQNSSHDSVTQSGSCISRQRVRVLEAAIRQAVTRLEESKRTFKSRQIKEVREGLLRLIDGER